MTTLGTSAPIQRLSPGARSALSARQSTGCRLIPACPGLPAPFRVARRGVPATPRAAPQSQPGPPSETHPSPPCPLLSPEGWWVPAPQVRLAQPPASHSKDGNLGLTGVSPPNTDLPCSIQGLGHYDPKTVPFAPVLNSHRCPPSILNRVLAWRETDNNKSLLTFS